MRRGEIVSVNFDPVRRSEANKTRPAVVVSNDAANAAATRLGRGVITVVPVTSNIARVYPFQLLLPAQLTGLPQDSKAQAEQIRSVSVDRVGGLLGRLPPALVTELDRVLRVQLSLLARTRPGARAPARDGKIMTEFYIRPDEMPPGNGYSHAVAFTGRTVVVSGQLPLDRDGKLAGTEAETQVRQVFQNLSAALAAAGASMAQVVKLTVYLTDLADLAVFRQVRDEFVSVDYPPASSLVQVAGLVHPQARVEIEALATTTG